MDTNEILKNMTLEEKASFVSGADFWHTKAVDRLGIEGIMMTDGPHGVRKIEDDPGSQDSATVEAICFPSGSTLACSFDRELLSEVGRTLGRECVCEDVDMLLGPAVNIKRSPLCGRNFEYFSEDPYLAGELGAAYVNGLQSTGTAASVKHFAVNNQETRRCTISAYVDKRALFELYLKPFEKIVKQSRPRTVMCSYNKINGTYSSQNHWLTSQILRDRWGFDGFVETDWGAACDRVEGLKAGVDLEMPGDSRSNTEKIVNAVRSGELEESILDEAVANILRFVEQARESEKPETEFDRKKDHRYARDVAGQCMVLLKNEGALPLKKDENILFVGQFARKPRYQGGGSSHINPHKVYNAYKASERYATVDYTDGYRIGHDDPEPELINRAVELARKADKVVIFAGLTEVQESEGFDRTTLRIPRSQNRLIEEIARVQKNTVVVMHNGAPVSMPWAARVNAILEAYLGGESGAEAETDILFGKVNPSGKLAESFPIALSDTPCYDNFPGQTLTVEYRESIFTGYRYYDRMKLDVLYPFGHGLSYTTFEYGDASLERLGEKVKVRFNITNTGDVDGAEVAQVYVGRTSDSIVFRPVKELKGFEKVFLKAGETRQVEIDLGSDAFEFFNPADDAFCVEDGEYTVFIGSSSKDIRLELKIDIEGLGTKPNEAPYDRASLPSYFEGDPAIVSSHEFEVLLGFPLPSGELEAGHVFDIHNTLDQARNTRFGKILIGAVKVFFKGKSLLGSNEMLIRGALESPFHALPMFTGGLFSEEMTEAVVDLINEKNIPGSLKTLAKGGINLAKGGIVG